jgi:DnaJ family protein C protein 13
VEQSLAEDGSKKSYSLKDVDSVVDVSPGHVFCLRMKLTDRLHIFSHPEKSKIIHRLVENAGQFLGVNLPHSRTESTVTELLESRLGVYAGDQHLTSLSEFAVQNVKRQRVLLCLSETCLLERDPGTYAVST